MPAAAYARVAARLAEHGQRRRLLGGFRLRWLPALTFVAGAAVVLMVVALGLRSVGDQSPQVEAVAVADEPAEAAPSGQVTLGDFAVHGAECRAEGAADDVLLRGSCRLVAAALLVQTWEQARLRLDGAVAMREGTALFDVQSVPAGAEPVRIEVSHGAIEVLGTRFQIEQWVGGGQVDLFEGRIRFVPHEGEAVEILPGQRHTWGAPSSGEVASREPVVEVGDDEVAMVEPPVVQAKPRQRRGKRSRSQGDADPPATKPADDPSAVIEHAASLRARGEHHEAARVLRAALRDRGWDRRTAQVLSYELGELLTRHLGDADAACEHWAEHQRRYAGGRYDAAVKRAQARLGCSET